MLNDFYPYFHILISISLGLLIGLQREWAESTLAGIRSFSLITLFGTLCALLSNTYSKWFLIIGIASLLFITLMTRLITVKETGHHHKGLVTELSILIMYCIGALVIKEPMIAAAITCLVAAILHEKNELHSVVAKFDKQEIRSIMQFLLISLVILPIVPNKTFGPEGALNFHNTWLMVIIIFGISLFGYIIYKFRGGETGILWGGILGGVISSTATTLSYARSNKNSNQLYVFNGLIILIAWSTLYVRVFLELHTVAPHFNVTLPLLILLIVSTLSIAWSWKRSHQKFSGIPLPYNPTSLTTALIFAISYSVIIYAFSFFKNHLGESGMMLLSFVSGIMDVDAITLSIGRLISKNLLTEKEGYRSFFIAIIANISFKGILTLILGGNTLFKFIFLPWILSLMTALLIILFSYLPHF